MLAERGSGKEPKTVLGKFTRRLKGRPAGGKGERAAEPAPEEPEKRAEPEKPAEPKAEAEQVPSKGRGPRKRKGRGKPAAEIQSAMITQLRTFTGAMPRDLRDDIAIIVIAREAVTGTGH